MIIFVYFLIAPIVFGSQNVTDQNSSMDLSTIDSLIEESAIDEEWVNYLETAPATINLLGEIMIVASTEDVSFETNSLNHVFKYMKYPKSFHSTLFQISKESYRAFDNAHRKMSKIQMHMKQILRYIEIISKISSNDSAKVVNRVLQKSVKNMERIRNTCVVLARNAEDPFKSLLKLLDEVIEVTHGLYKLRFIEQERLSQEEKVIDAIYLAAMGKMRSSTPKSDVISAKNVRSENTIELLRREMKLLTYPRRKCQELYIFFENVYGRVARDFNEKLKSLISTTSGLLDSEQTEIEIKFILNFIRGDLIDLYQESYLVFILSSTYYDVSSKYLIPRLPGLSSMLRNTSDDERKASISKLQQDTEDVQKKIKELIAEQRKNYKKTISKKRAKINEIIDHRVADENEMDIIEQGKKLIGF